MLVTLSPLPPEAHAGHVAQSPLPGCSPPAEARPASVGRPSQSPGQLPHPGQPLLSTIPAVWQVGLPCKQPWQEPVCTGGDMAVPLQLRAGGSASVGLSPPNPSGSWSSSGEPRLCLKAKPSLLQPRVRDSLCSSKYVTELKSQMRLGRAIHRLLSS